MPPAAIDSLVYDLSMLARGTALAERMLVTWLEHMEVFDKLADFDRMNQCVDSLTRVAAIRKSLIRLAIVVKRYGPDAPAPPHPQSEIPTPQSEIDYISIPPAEAADVKRFSPPIFPESPRVSLGSMINFMYYMNIPEGSDAFQKSSFGKRFAAAQQTTREPAIYPPDREPNLAESRDIREVAAIPPDKLSAALDRVTADVTTMPGPSTPASSKLAPPTNDPTDPPHSSPDSHTSHPPRITALDLAPYATPAEYFLATPITESAFYPPDAAIPPPRPPS
ncbi:MAG: hypothetical protein ABFD69_01300 [Candidatus Sumerlaeia bacterium]